MEMMGWLLLWAATVGPVVYMLNRRMSALEDRIRHLEGTINQHRMPGN